MSPPWPDGVRRFMMPDGAFRFLVAHTTAMVGEAARHAQTAPEVTSLYGDLLTGTLLLELAQAPIDRIQCSLSHSGTVGSLLADVWPGGFVRGRVEHPRAEHGPYLDLQRGGLLQVSRQPARGGDLYQSAVPIPPGDSSVAESLQRYCLESEQVLTFYALVTIPDPQGGIERAAGLIIQALPDARREDLAALTRCLERARFEDLVAAGDHPYDATLALFRDLSLHHLGDDPVTYRCRCSVDVAVDAVRLLGAEAIAAIREGATESVTCEFCQTVYVIGSRELGYDA